MELEEGIPIPVRGGPRSALGRAFAKMKVNDSFKTDRQKSSIYSLARYYRIEIKLRKENDGIMRVWRTK
jgi:hypothetical protein